MLDPNFITIGFYVCVVKFFSIITPYLVELHFKFILCSLDKLLEICGHFGFVMKEAHPSISRVVINYHKAIEVAS